MFSSRLSWQTTANQLTLLLQEKRKNNIPILDLTISNPTQVELFEKGTQSQKIQQIFLDSLTDPHGFFYHPHPQGIKEARDAICQDYQTRNIDINPEHLLLCASTSEAYTFLFQLFCNPGESILSPKPSYPLFEHLAGLTGVTQVPYSLYFYDRWCLDFDSLEKAYSEKIKAVVVVHPNNPTGSFLSKQETEWILTFCEKHQLPLIVDEVFFDYSFLLSHSEIFSFATLASSKNVLCFVLSGISKVLGLPQLKLSWIYSVGPEPLRSQAQAHLELIADTFLSVSTPSQFSVSALLPKRELFQQPIQTRIHQNLTALKKQTQGTLCQLLRIEGGFSAVLKLPKLLSEEEWVLLLLEQDHLLCHPGYFFDFTEEPYFVLSLLTPPDIFIQGVSLLLARLEQVASLY